MAVSEIDRLTGAAKPLALRRATNGNSTMSDLDRNYVSPFGRAAGRVDAATVDAGLRAYMLRIYNYMSIGLAITGLAALGVYMATVTTDPSVGAVWIGVMCGSLVRLLLQSLMLEFIVSVVGVLVSARLTAWDTQRLKNHYIYGYASGGADVEERAAITGALSLYLSFINLFTLLLQ